MGYDVRRRGVVVNAAVCVLVGHVVDQHVQVDEFLGPVDRRRRRVLRRFLVLMVIGLLLLVLLLLLLLMVLEVVVDVLVEGIGGRQRDRTGNRS